MLCVEKSSHSVLKQAFLGILFLILGYSMAIEWQIGHRCLKKVLFSINERDII